MLPHLKIREHFIRAMFIPGVGASRRRSFGRDFSDVPGEKAGKDLDPASGNEPGGLSGF